MGKDFIPPVKPPTTHTHQEPRKDIPKPPNITPPPNTKPQVPSAPPPGPNIRPPTVNPSFPVPNPAIYPPLPVHTGRIKKGQKEYETLIEKAIKATDYSIGELIFKNGSNAKQFVREALEHLSQLEY